MIMWNLMKRVGVALNILSNDSLEKYDEGEESKILKVLEASDSEDDDIVTTSEHNAIVTDLCNHKVGYVTHLSDDGSSGMIDGLYYFEFTNAPSDIRVGDRVGYIAFRKTENSLWIVKNVYAVINDEWDNTRESCTSGDEEAQNIQGSGVKECNIVGKIVKRCGREIYIQPGNYSCHLDKISTTFVPVEGDWVLLKSLVEVDNNAVDRVGKLLQIESLLSLRNLVDQGKISHWEPSIKQGIIDSKVQFSLDTCDLGFIPVVGDQVMFDAIESEQGALVWRAIKVVPAYENRMIRKNSKKQHDKNQLVDSNENDSAVINSSNPENIVSVDDSFSESDSDLFKNKNGIIISENIYFDGVDTDSEKELVILVKNESSTRHQLLSASFKATRSRMQSQIWLMSPVIKENSGIHPRAPFYIQEWGCVRFIFKIKPRFVGKTSELFVWKFKDFEIGRRININVTSKIISEVQKSKPKKFTHGSCNINAEKILATRNGFVVCGEKKFRAHPFVPVKLGPYPVPNRLWEAVLGNEVEDRFRDNVMRKVQDVIPCLYNPLNQSNYKQRFHALLYLEEIACVVSLRAFDIERAHFRKHLDYLVLEVPGLAEKRPSLVCGDIIIVSNPCDVGDKEDVKYEGIIHKVCKTEVWIKFNKSFHDNYDGADYSVTFTINRMGFRRCHQGINSTFDHLSVEWLFPTGLRESKTQIIIEEDSCDSDNNNERVVDESRPKIDRVCEDHNIKWQSTGRNWKYETEQLKSRIRDVPITYRRKIKWFNPNLNHCQKEAVKNILKGEARPLPYIIFGPPGTGKTITLVEAALQLLHLIPESRLLIATPSNSAADLIAERMLDSGLDMSGVLVRLCSFSYFGDDNDNVKISDRLRPYCTTADIKIIEDHLVGTAPGRHDNKNQSSRDILGRHRVTIGTCVTLGVLYNMGFPQGHFTHILIDEAGQATEPEVLIPLAFLDEKYGQAILAGDPMQLGPVVQSRWAEELGLQESLLYRFLQNFPYLCDMESFPDTYGFDPRVVTRLVDNYRSLPELLKLPSMMFYDDSLVAKVKEVDTEEAKILMKLKDDLPVRDFNDDTIISKLPPALVFHGIRGVNYQEKDSPSWFNPQEIVQVIFYLNMFYKVGLTSEQIGIVTPYQKQVMKIRSFLTKLEIPLPKVGSVEEFQGQERMVIILSTVRSNSKLMVEDIKYSLGFVSSPRRLNVALTRARAVLVIIGNPHLLNCDPHWRTVLKYCIKNKSYCGCDLPSELES